MNYKEEIQKALDNEDWFTVMTLSSEVREKSVINSKHVLDVQPGIIPIFSGFKTDEVQPFIELLELSGFTVHRGNHSVILRKVDLGKILPNEKTKKIAICTNSESLKARLEAKNFICKDYWVCNEFLYSVKNHLKYPITFPGKPKKYHVIEKHGKMEYIVDEITVKALNRNSQIEKILE